MMNSVLVYIHRGHCDYMDDVFAITRHYNKETWIILIGDSDNHGIANKYSIEHHLFSEYNEEIPYHHVSVNPETYEVYADGELLTCEPADELPMAQLYFLL